MEISFVFFCIAPVARHASLHILFRCPAPAIGFETATKPSRFTQFCEGANSIAHATKNVNGTSKRGANIVCLKVFNILTSTFDTCFAPQQRARFRHLSCQKCSDAKVFLTFWLWNVLRATAACNFSAVQYFEMCFAPQPRALFQQLKFQKCSDYEVFLTFSLENMFRTTAACNFWSLIRPDGSAPIALASLLLDPQGLHNIGKTQCFARFAILLCLSLSLSLAISPSLSLSLFSLTLHTLIFFLLAPSSLTLPTTVAASVQKSEIWIPNFLHLLLCGHFKPFKRACKHSVDWIFCLKKSNGHRHGKPIALSFRRKSSKL